MDNRLATLAADNIRILAAAMVEKAKSGHPGGAMGGADFIQVLYSEFLNFDPDRMDWPFRDRFFLDPGHMSPMLYGVLYMTGNFTLEELKSFRQWHSTTPGHPELNVMRGIENTSGPLGQGHTMAVGAAIAGQFIASRFGDWTRHNIFTFISDGGVQEEISQGAGRIAGFLGLNNLIMFYDSNSIQLSTDTAAVTREDTAAKYRSWGWRVLEVNGHHPGEIREAIHQAVDEQDQPVLIIGHTIMGKGCVTADGMSFEGQSSTHGQPISKAGASFEKTVENLGGDPKEPFRIFDRVEEYYQKVLIEKRLRAKESQNKEAEWRHAHPDQADQLDRWLTGRLPDLNWHEIICKANASTREASGVVLAYLAEKVDNLIVMSADLSNSDKTDGFLKKSHAFTVHNFSGAFLQVGVSELTMAALANGMALHGGVTPACGTFFVFSDYMKPAVRMAALMELPVKYIWTHDAFRVGEDGPTHQPVEQEAQIRLMEQLKNHSGQPSLLALRPADGAETIHAWRVALENDKVPTALLLSRQGITDLPSTEKESRYDQASRINQGAYVVWETGSPPDVILLGNGSEVATLYAGAQLLFDRKQIRARVVSAPSESLFRQQPPKYQHEVLNPEIPVFALTAGLPVTLRGLAGTDARIWGVDHFGYSAPAGVLDEQFGFTPENVYQQTLDLLSHQEGRKLNV